MKVREAIFLLLIFSATSAKAESYFRMRGVSSFLGITQSWNCVPRATTGDSDPSSKVSILLQYNDMLQPLALRVIHETMSGATHNRADQYEQSEFKWKSTSDFHWTGVSKKNPSVTMRGTMNSSPNKPDMYEESGFDEGRKIYEMVSACEDEPKSK
jgi:hypothetical protein